MSQLKNPLWPIVAVLALFVGLAFAGGTGGYFAGGGLALAFNGLLALAYGLLCIRAVRYLNLTVNHDEADKIGGSANAAAIRVFAIYAFSGLCVLAVFG